MPSTTHSSAKSTFRVNARCKPSTSVQDITITKKHLEDLSEQIFQLCNTRDFSGPIRKHIAPVARISHENAEIYDEKDLITHLEGVVRACPYMHVETLSTSAWVYEETGNATVWLMNEVTGMPNGMRAESVAGLCWECREGEWLCTRYMGLRSVAMVDC